MKKRHRCGLGGLLLLSGLLIPMAGFAEGEPVPSTHDYIREPVLISTSDAHRNLLECALFFQLVHHHPDRASPCTQVMVIYWTVKDLEISRSYLLWDYAGTTATSSWQLSLLGLDTLSLSHHDRDEARTVDQLLPLYGYRNESSGDRQGSAIGPPPLGRSTTWSIDEHTTTPTMVTDRFNSVYRHSHDERTGQTIINVLGSESVSLFRARRRISQSFQNPYPPYNYLADYPPGTNSLTETVLIISARVVLGILFHQLRAEQASLPWGSF